MAKGSRKTATGERAERKPATRPPDAEIEERIDHARRMIADGQRTPEILDSLMERFNICQSTAYVAHNEARARFRASRASDVEAEHVRAIRVRDELYLRALELGDIPTALAVERDRARLLAMYPTDRAALARAGLDESMTKAVDSGASPLATMLRDALAQRAGRATPAKEASDGRGAE